MRSYTSSSRHREPSHASSKSCRSHSPAVAPNGRPKATKLGVNGYRLRNESLFKTRRRERLQFPPSTRASPLRSIRAEFATDLFESSSEFFFVASIDRAVVFPVDSQVVHRGDAIFLVVSVLIAFAVAELLRALIVPIAQRLGNGNDSLFPHVFSRGRNARRGGVRFRSASQIGNELCQTELAFGQSDQFTRVSRCNRQRQCLRVGVSDIFAGQDHHSPADEANILTTLEHSRQPIECRIGITPANRFDQGARDVVVQISRCVVVDDSLLEAFADQRQIDANRWLIDRADCNLQRSQNSTRIAVAHVDQKLGGVVVDRDVESPESTELVLQGAVDQLPQVFGLKRLELKDLTPAEKSSVDGEERVLGRGADEDHDSFLDIGEERILLRLVEAVDFVDEEQCAAGFRFQAFASRFENGAEFLHATADGAELHEGGSGFGRQQPRERRLAAAGRSVEDDRPEPISLEEPPQELALIEKMALPGELGESPRAHPRCQRLGLLAVASFNLVKESCHVLYHTVMQQHRHPVAKGRGTHLNPRNRFESVETRADWEQIAAEDPDALAPAVATEYLPDDSQSIVSTNDSPDIPFRYSLNPYRGCQHGCAYCYARPTHEYLGMSAGLDFEAKILVKHRAAELFRGWLAKRREAAEVVVFSGVTDCYQPCERRYLLTRRCLEVALEARQPVGIVTKNALVLRDLDLLKEMAAVRTIRVFFSVTTLDPELARVMEPRTSTPQARLRAIGELRAAGVPVGVMTAPIVPGLNDTELPAILKQAAAAGAQSAGYQLLRLPLSVEPIFMDWLERTEGVPRERIESRIRATRGGKLSESRFGDRMRGHGEIAASIKSIFDVFAREYDLDGELPPLDGSRFRPPSTGGQRWLF